MCSGYSFCALTPDLRVGSASDFWRLLSCYEDATIQEAMALSESNFSKLDALSLYKKATLQRMQQLGERMGLDRRNKELRERLESLEQAEVLNLETAASMVAQIQGERHELYLTRRRLTSLRGAYAGDTPPNEFFAKG